MKIKAFKELECVEKERITDCENYIFFNEDLNILFISYIKFTNIKFGALESDDYKTNLYINDDKITTIKNENIPIGNIKNITFLECVVDQFNLHNDIDPFYLSDTFSFIKFHGEIKKIIIHNFNFEKYAEFCLTNNCDTVNISNCHFVEKLKIRNEESNNGTENPKIKIKSLTLQDCRIGAEGYLRLGFLDCDKFVLSNLRNPKDAEVNIGECIFGSFKLTNFRNMGKFKIFNIESEENKEDTKFQIDNTSIGDADFQNINLQSFNKVIMYDNIVHNLHYTNIKWKDSIEVNNYKDTKDLIEKQQDTYRTLKNVAIMNNDRPQALMFFVKEMQEYKKLILEINGKCINGDILTLRFNEWTNNFGLSWTKPLIFLLISSLIFYTLLLSSISTNEIMPEIIFKKFFVFVNPIHKVEFIFENCWGFWSYFIDSVFRIIEGLLVYQMIQGFRKYSRNL